MTFDEAHRAIKRGQTNALGRTIRAGLCANASNHFHWTLLMLAAIEGTTAIGSLLLESGADVSLLNDVGESALSLAAHKGHLPFVQLLLRSGASSNVRPHGHDLERWLRSASGLPPEKIDRILACLDRAVDK